MARRGIRVALVPQGTLTIVWLVRFFALTVARKCWGFFVMVIVGHGPANRLAGAEVSGADCLMAEPLNWTGETSTESLWLIELTHED